MFNRHLFMKHLVSFILSVAAFSVHAQSYKMTNPDPCNYSGSIVQITPTPDYDSILVNGQRYSIDVSLVHDMYQTCYGNIYIMLGNTQIGITNNVSNGPVRINLDVFNKPPGYYKLSFLYSGSDNGYTMDTKGVTVINPSTTSPNSFTQPETAPASIDHSSLNENNETLWPIPSHDILNLKMNEVIQQVKVLNTTGALVQTVYPNDTKAIIATNALPAGMYFVLVQTPNRLFTGKFVVQH